MNNLESEKFEPIYYSNLDATRFIAAFAVFLLHFSNEIRAIYPSLTETNWFNIFYLFAGKGGLGVNFFFVLSGFLITYLILQERKNYNQFHLGRFLIRRSLRIWPLYFIVGGLGFFLFPLIFSEYYTLHQPTNYFLFLANFDEIWFGAMDPINFLTAPWSVAVEEQFYLFWGLSLFVLFKLGRINLLYFILPLYLVSFWFRFEHWQEERILYHHTIAVAQDILTGAIIGFSLFNGKKWITWIHNLKPSWLLLGYLFGFALCILKNRLFPGELVIIERFVLSLFFGFIIIDQVRNEKAIYPMGKIKPFNYLGKISYGLYMYHLVVMFLLNQYIDFSALPWYIGVVLYMFLSLGLTIGIASLSYHFIEAKFLSLKPKHRKHET
ncbi:MAG: acyltransferase family protein [Crocinitomicaceae bacterium]